MPQNQKVIRRTANTRDTSSMVRKKKNKSLKSKTRNKQAAGSRLATSIKTSPPTPPPGANPPPEDGQGPSRSSAKHSLRKLPRYETTYESRGRRATALTELNQTAIRTSGSPSPKRGRTFEERGNFMSDGEEDMVDMDTEQSLLRPQVGQLVARKIIGNGVKSVL